MDVALPILKLRGIGFDNDTPEKLKSLCECSRKQQGAEIPSGTEGVAGA